MRSIHGTALAALLLVSMTGCSSHKAAAAEGTTAATTATDGTPAVAAADSGSEDKTGTGHVSLTGEYPLEHDFTVEMCQVGPPGDGLLSGYHMTSKSGESDLGLIGVTLKDYAKDGPYVQASLSREAAVGQAMNSGSSGALTLMLLRDQNSPLAFGQVPGSKMTITISNDGAKGIAEFTDLESQISMEGYDPSAGGTPRGKRVSGSVSWTCGTVGRLNAQMNDAVNGMFKKLIPPR